MIVVPDNGLFTYRGTLVKVIDGDTVDVEIDLGFKTFNLQRLRLLGLDTPEKNAKDQETVTRAFAAEAFTKAWFMALPTKYCLVKTQKSDSFGRYLATVYDYGMVSCLNAALLTNGHAVPWTK